MVPKTRIPLNPKPALTRGMENRTHPVKAPPAKPLDCRAVDCLGRAIRGAVGAISAPLAAAMSMAMRNQRGEQIDRLMKLFESNPDKALQYAIPMGGDSSWRGFSIPGSELMRRMTDYSSGLFGGSGGPTDFWSLPFEVENRLRAKYRQQANRELAAGRFRRAAYVLAHLLGDFRGAAEALEKGKHFVEAAELYRDKLNNRDAAAKCLHRGGLYREAAEIYESLKAEGTAGEILLEAGLSDEAEAVFLRGYDRLMSEDDVVAAAKMLYDSLQRQDEAIECLVSQWPDGVETVPAANQAFQWLGELGRHDEAAKTLRDLDQKTDSHQRLDWARVHVQTANSYPSTHVRRLAEDTSRLSLATALADTSTLQRNEALALFRSLDHTDRQLSRDTHRYVKRTRKPNRPEATPRVGRKVHLTSPDEIRMPFSMKVVDGIVIKSRRYLVLRRKKTINVTEVLGSPNDPHLQSTKTAKVLTESDDCWIHGLTFLDRRTVTIWVMADVDQRIKKPAAQTLLEPAPTLALRPKEDRLASQLNPDGASASVVVENPGSGAAVYTLRMQGGATQDLNDALQLGCDDKDWADLQNPTLVPVNLALMGARIFISIGRHLLMFDGSVRHIHSLPSVIHSMAGSMKGTRERLAIATASGLHIYFTDQFECRLCSEDAEYSDCVWLAGGWLIAVRDNHLDVFHASPSHPDTFVKVGEQRDTRITPGKLLAWSPASVALLRGDQPILVWKLS